jgi:hypothetical protein
MKNNNKNFVLIFILINMSLSGCSGISRNVSNLLFPPYPSSDQRIGEDTTLELTPITPKDKACPQKKNPSEEALAALAGPAIDFAIKEVEKFLQDEAKRYTASYSASAIDDCFYNGIEVNLEKITLKRNTKRGQAMVLELGIAATRDQTAFQINPLSVTLTNAKAKVAAIDITRPFGFDILAPWTILQIAGPRDLFPLRPAQVDMSVNVLLHGIWVDEKGIGHSELVASRNISIPNVPIGSPSIIFNNEELKNLNLKKELFPVIPRSNTKSGAGYGNYIVSVLVTENDSFGERVTQFADTVKNNESTITKGISKLLE